MIHRNTFYVFLLLIVSLVGTYIFIELPEYQKIITDNKKKYFFREMNISEIHLKEFELYKRISNKTWRSTSFSEELIDQKNVKILIERLRMLRIEKEIDPKPFYNFKNKLEIHTSDKDRYVLELGDKQPFSEKYYVSFCKNDGEKKIFLVKDTSPQIDPIPDHLFSINPYKYKAILTAIKSQETDWLFNGITKNKINSITFDKKIGSSFTVSLSDFQVKATHRFYDKQNFNLELVKNWAKKFLEIKASRVLTKLNNKEVRYLGSFSFNDENINHDIYLDHNGGQNVYLQKKEFDKSLSFIFSIDDLKIIYPNLQDFMNKSLLKFKNNEVINIEIEGGNAKTYDISARPVSDYIDFSFKGVSLSKQNYLKEIVISMFQEANYLSFGNEMTIHPEFFIKIKINEDVYDYGHAHGMIEIFDKRRKISFFHRAENFEFPVSKVNL